MPLKEEVLGQFLGDETFPDGVDVRDREAPVLGLRRPALPEAAQPDVRGHRRLVALLRSHVPPLRHAVRDGLDLQEHQRLPVHDRDPGRGRRRRRHAGVQLRDSPDRARGRRVRRQDRRLPGRGPARLRAQLHRLVADPLRPRDAAQLRLHRGDAGPEGPALPGRGGRPPRGRHRHARPSLEDPLDAELRAAQRDAQPPCGDGEDPRQDRRGPAGPAPELGQRPQLGQDPGPLGDEGGGQGRPGPVRHLRGAGRHRDRAGAQGQRARPPVHRRAGGALPEGVRLARGLEPRVHLPELPGGHDPGRPADPRPVRVGLRLPDQDRGPGRPTSTRRRSRSSRGSRARRSRRCAPPTRSTSRWRR